MFAKTPKILSLIFILTICFVFNSSAQTQSQNDLGVEVKLLGGTGEKHLSCSSANNLVVSKQEFEALLNDEKCSILKSFEIDFSKHTLINYTVGGDCFMRVTHKIFRNDKTKTYTVEVKNYWGKCRAGGFYRSWVVIDKIPADYKVELKELKIDSIREKKNDKMFSVSNANRSKPPTIEFIASKQVDLKGCVPMYQQNQLVIQDKESYLKNLRIDAQTKQCVKNAKSLELDKYSYIGVRINSGYCRYPKGLKHEFYKRITKNEYILTVSYTDPEGQVCRAYSRYDLWIQVPKLPKDAKVKLKITPKPRTKKHSEN